MVVVVQAAEVRVSRAVPAHTSVRPHRRGGPRGFLLASHALFRNRTHSCGRIQISSVKIKISVARADQLCGTTTVWHWRKDASKHGTQN